MKNWSLITIKPSLPNAQILANTQKRTTSTISASCIVSLYSYLSNGYCHIGLIYNFVCKTSRCPNNNRLSFLIFACAGCSYTSKLIVVTPKVKKKVHGVETLGQIVATVHKLRLLPITGESNQLHACEMCFLAVRQ